MSGLKFSVLGDSISTLEGYTIPGYSLFYYQGILQVREMADSWWGRVIRHFQGSLLVNNAWSGSRVAWVPELGTLFPSGCSPERTGLLHNGDLMPDVILVYMGVNDWASGLPIGQEQSDLDCFRPAYRQMLQALRTNYPQSDIWCMTLCPTWVPQKPLFRFPLYAGGIHIEEYNQVIREMAQRFDCRLVDLFALGVPYETLDGTHPTLVGHRTLGDRIIQLVTAER